MGKLRPVFANGGQHDAHEFLCKLLDAMSDDSLRRDKLDHLILKWKAPERVSRFPYSIFGFHTQQVTSWSAEEEEKMLAVYGQQRVAEDPVQSEADKEPQLILSAPIPPGKNVVTVEECAESPFLEGLVDEFRTPRGVLIKSPHVKSRVRFIAGGRVVILLLKRFNKRIERTVQDGKNVETVFTSKDQRHVSLSERLKGTYLELVAVIEHVGDGPNQGHYVCYGKKGEKWRVYDDDRVKEVEQDVVFSKQAYILFYQTTDE
eukprot:Hpha_TRINITY_DN1383_c0_g1::TRINITY_DN1383_c0_g1_i1::g.93432::m.93432/K11842/USP12_46; ubiquitin carboxyl-terminal hydrolase 12/46